MRVLLAVARHGGVLAAADELHISPSAVSQQLTKLEQEAGTPLTHRTPRGTVLTPAGTLVAEAAEEIERALGVVHLRLVEGANDVEGQVRLCGFASFVRTVVAPHLSRWRERYPRLEIEIYECNHDEAMRRLRSGEVDAAVVELDITGKEQGVPSRGVLEEPLLDDPWRLLVPTGARLPASSMDLGRLGLPWLGTLKSAANTVAISRARSAAEGPLEWTHHYEETTTALALVAAGQGVTVLPALALQGLDTQGIDAHEVPGLGVRRIVLRRIRRKRPTPTPTETVIRLMRDAIGQIDLSPTVPVGGDAG